ncbi:MAG UNVERIFIED_CONTAM: hypothetical protein LVT10_23170 [Anaerolineae bacterium]|jgi:beta-phosphoglucomutase-like phosphatase (HAD superfamily)
MSITTVIFDMDGVLVDSEIYWQQAREDFAREMGKVWTLDDQRLAMGRSTVGWAGVMQTRLGKPLERGGDHRGHEATGEGEVCRTPPHAPGCA